MALATVNDIYKDPMTGCILQILQVSFNHFHGYHEYQIKFLHKPANPFTLKATNETTKWVRATWFSGMERVTKTTHPGVWVLFGK